MPNGTDYVAATIAAMSEEVAPAVEAPAAPAAGEPSVPAAPAVETPAPALVEGAPVVEEAKKEVEKPAEKPLPDRIAKSFEDLAREKAAFREEKAQFSTGQAKAMTEAATKKDAMALLAAAGISWADAARQVLEGSGAKPPQRKAEPDEPDPRDARLAALEAEIQGNKANAMRAKVLTDVRTLVGGNPKFKHVAGLEAEQAVIEYIENYHAQTGELPGENLAESLEIATEAVETHLAKEATRWAKVLTTGTGVATKDVKPAVPAVGVVSQVKTLTNNSGSGPKTAPIPPKKPKTEEEYQALALAALTAL